MRALRGRIVLLLVALLVIVRLGDMAVEQSFYAPGPLKTSAALVIPPGCTAYAAKVLERDGAITYPLVFRAAAWVTRKQGPIHAGEFFIPARSSLAEILRILRHGTPVQHQVTIPEGLTGAQIVKILNAAHAASGRAAAPAEGAVLPQTYDFTLGTQRQVILARAMEAMRRSLESAWALRDVSVPLQSPQEALILASIVQQESPVAAELPEIAAVYENRLAKGMKLQADPTVIYAASGGRNSGGPRSSGRIWPTRRPITPMFMPGCRQGRSARRELRRSKRYCIRRRTGRCISWRQGPAGMYSPTISSSNCRISPFTGQAKNKGRGMPLPCFSKKTVRKSAFAGADASESLVELRNLTARVDHALHAGPGRMGFRVDIEAQGFAGFAHAGPGFEFRTIGHDDVDLVIVRMNVRFHRVSSIGIYGRRSRPAAKAAHLRVRSL